MPDIRQTSLYGQFMQKIGWKVECIDDIYIFVLPFPLIGATIKIQRADKLPNNKTLQELVGKYPAHSISVEPSELFSTKISYKLIREPFLPTKTIYIDLTPPIETVFKRFSEAKQRAVRRAQKNGVVIKHGEDIDTFIRLKNKAGGLFGFIATASLKPLWSVFAPEHMSVLVAYCNGQPHASVLLAWYDKRAYYWMAAATKEGKKQFAPTLLVWESLKLAKHHGCTVFDFEGIYDERYPGLNTKWHGFTKFKEGFGGKHIHFPQPFTISTKEDLHRK